MRGNTTPNWLARFAPAALFGLAFLFCFGSSTPARAGQSDGQSSTQNSAQGSPSGQTAARSSARATNAGKQNTTPEQPQNGSQNAPRTAYTPAKVVSAARSEERRVG